MVVETKKQMKTSALARLAPNAIKTVVDGMDVIVAADKTENDALNMIAVGVIRALFNDNLHKLKDKKNNPQGFFTPKEMRDLAESLATIVKLSKEAYAGADPIADVMKNADSQKTTPVSEVNFDNLVKPIDVEVKTTQ